jgi:gamma-glutamyltranspeptidase/glutathione hydrolase
MLFLWLFNSQCGKSDVPTYFQHGALATAAPIATHIGREVFAAGGNAFDVAVAVGFALTVVHPEAGNIGGGGFALIRDGRTGDIKSLDFREKAPAAAHEKMYLGTAGQVIENLSTVGAKAVGVPGTVAGLFELWKTHGSMEWYQLVDISAALADSGFILDQYQVESFKKYQKRLMVFPETAALYFPNGQILQPGERLIQNELGKTLALIASGGPDSFYVGSIADSLVATIKRHDGIVTREDLKDYLAVWRVPVSFRFDSFQIYSMPPPSSGGIVLGQMLKILERYNFSEFTPDSVAYAHLFCEAARLAYADRSQHLGDPDFFDIPAFLLDNDYLRQRAGLIQINHANVSQEILPGMSEDSESKQTTHFSVADDKGNVVSLTYTLNSSYGSKLAVRGCGFLLNNEMDDFAIAPGHANLYGLVGGEANKVEPYKRMLSSMSPTIVM